MSEKRRIVGLLAAGVLGVAVLGTCLGTAFGAVSGAGSEKALAQQILEDTGVRGGLVVHLGCGDGQLTAALHAADAYLVHGLDTDAKTVETARAHVRSLGLYGKVSIERFDGRLLPYADNLVNLVVAEDLGEVPATEVMRVLCPDGVAYIKKGATWSKTVKPRPGNTDEWTHYLHDASGNAVAHDEVVGPPRRVQWIAQPRHTRSHEHIPSLYALVSTGGRIFYVADEGAIGAVNQPPRWYLLARDAYNGTLLWKRPIAAWFPHLVNWGQTPSHLQRRLVAVGDRVYVTLGLHAPLSAVDAATGETLKVYDETRGTEEVLCHNGVLLLAVRSVTAERTAELQEWAGLVTEKKSPVYVRETAEPLVKRLRAVESGGERTVLALDAGTGRLLWKKAGDDVAGLRPDTLSAIGDRVFYQKGRDVVCLDLKTGRDVWSAPSAPLRVVCERGVVCADANAVAALSAETGKTLWTQPATLCQIRDVFVAGGSLWVGGFKPYQGRTTGKRGPAWGPYFATQRDLDTGKMLRHVEPEGPGHHHRCWRNKATDRYILGGRRGVEFIDLASGDVLWHSWVRGVCRYGVMPANGLLYAPPHACACYIAAKLDGFYALAPAAAGPPATQPLSPRLEKGPAFSEIPNLRSEISKADWPTYRHDAARSGRTTDAVPAVLSRRWQADVGPTLTSPTVCGGKVFVASADEHRVSAIDADSGRPAWHFTAGARVDSPPTLHKGRAIFGCRDGCVYSVRASDGVLAWRLRAARADRRITACGQLESPSPVHGSVLVHDGAACFTAGRSSYLDGGIDLYRLQPETGKVLSRTPIYSPDPETGRQPKQDGPAYMPGALGDILSGDDRHVYLRDTVFDSGGGSVEKGDPHLFTLTGFLDGTWPHRSYWIFGTRCSISGGCSGRDKDLVFGRLLVFDDSTTYGFGRAQVHWSNQLQDGPYRLFALKRAEGSRQWAKPAAIQVRAMVLADKVLFVAGPPAAGDGAETPGRNPAALLVAVSASDGTELARCRLDSPPVFDGMAAAGGRLYLAMLNGQVACYGRGK